MQRQSLRKLRMTLAWLACATWILPVSGRAATPLPPERPMSLIRDVALSADGRLCGQFLDMQGQPLAGQVVAVRRHDGQLLRATTDGAGRFAVDHVTGGLCRIIAADTAVVCRCWAPGTAPPAATPELLVVSGDGVLRGQRPITDLLFSGPVLIGLVIAAAIAIPIAVHNSQDDDAS